MSFFAILFKVIPYLMPFIREMLIGKKSWKQAFRENRGKTILTVAVAISVVFNLVLMTKVGSMAFNYLELSRAKQELEAKYIAMEKSKIGVVGTPKHPLVANTEVVAEIPKPVPPKVVTHHSPTAEEILAAEIKADMERIRQREAAEH